MIQWRPSPLCAVCFMHKVPPGCRLAGDLSASLDEARAVARHLSPLASTLRVLSEGAELGAVPAVVSRALGGVLLGCKHSHHCRTPTRLVAVLQALGNDVVNQAIRFLGGMKTCCVMLKILVWSEALC